MGSCGRHWATVRRRASSAFCHAEALECRLLFSPVATTSYSFTGGDDGSYPIGITVDASGNTYGVAQGGGEFGFGSIWELPVGTHSVNTLYSFTGGADGSDPISIVIDGSGNLFGTTPVSGANKEGTIWELASGSSSLQTLYSFSAGATGYEPLGITIDSNGNLYGTAVFGGAFSDGTVWELLSGNHKITTLSSFTNGAEGRNPWAITIDSANNLYGTTVNGGAGNGAVWELAKGSSTITSLYDFSGGVADGIGPEGITIDGGRNLFGTTTTGGPNGTGVIWELPYQSGTVTDLFAFTTVDQPEGLTYRNNGYLYGVAETGSVDNLGYIFRYIPTVDVEAKVAIIQQPTNAFDGLNITPSITVAVEDDNGNVVASDTSTITLSVASGPSNETVSVGVVHGVANFSSFILSTPGVYVLSATDGNLAGNTSSSFTIAVPGYVDAASMNDITGWAYDPTDPSASVNVEVAISGGPTQIFSADESRPDLQNLIGSSNHGFTYATPVLSAGVHTASIYVVEANNTMVLVNTERLVSQNSLFDEHYYLEMNPDVAAAVAAGTIGSGYDHYIEYGQFEGRSPSPYWDEAWYLQENPDVAAAVRAGKVSSGFVQYYLYGQYENRPGLLYFNTSYYLANNPDVTAAINAGTVTSAFEQFVLFGQYEGRSPMLYFSSSVYDANNSDILPFVTGEPLSSDFEQFIEYGQYEGRVASNFYNEATYLADNPDVAAAVIAGEFPDGFQHWLEYGQYEGRTAVDPPGGGGSSGGSDGGIGSGGGGTTLAPPGLLLSDSGNQDNTGNQNGVDSVILDGDGNPNLSD
jgi:uncharacterized repeat protein (TIGR03803 family)